MTDTFGFELTIPPVRPLETPEQRRIRIEKERVLVAQADADIDAGLGMDWDVVAAWLDTLDVDENAPEPTTAPSTSP